MEQLSTARQYLPTSCGRRQLPPSRRLVSFRICYSSILALLSPKAPAACSFFGHSAAAECGQR